MERRDFLQHIGALGAAAALPAAFPTPLLAKPYDPAAKFDLKASEVPFRRNAAGRQLYARIYQPQGAGPFPMVLDLHGGAWTRKDRSAEEPMDRAIASSGVVVVAIDMTLSGEAAYPANIQDANYGIRWLKSKAREWNADGSSVGIYGSSTGGHIAILLAMRPKDARYNAIPLEGSPNVDAGVAYVACRSPITDPYARWQQAEKMKRENLIKREQGVLPAVGVDPRGQPAADPRAQGSPWSCGRSSSCRVTSTTTCCLPCRRSSPRPTAPRAATAATSCSRTASTSGPASPGHRPTAPTRWSGPSSPATFRPDVKL